MVLLCISLGTDVASSARGWLDIGGNFRHIYQVFLFTLCHVLSASAFVRALGKGNKSMVVFPFLLAFSVLSLSPSMDRGLGVSFVYVTVLASRRCRAEEKQC